MKPLKFLLSILILYLCYKNISGQPYYSFPDTNTYWSAEGHNSYTQWQHHVRFGLKGDTIISGKIYKKIYDLYDSTLTHPLSYYYAAIREMDKRIYYIIDTFPEHILYDFNLNVGDTIKYYQLYYPDSFSRVVSQIDSVQLANGQYRKRFYLNDGYNCYHNDIWAEGIGSIDWGGLFNPLISDIITDGTTYTFSCFKVNDTILYFNNPLCDHCFCSLYVDIENCGYQRKPLIFFPNPTVDCTKLIFTHLPETIYTLTIYNSTGKVHREYTGIKNGEIIICKSELKSGLYIYELTGDNGFHFNGKLVMEE